MRTCIQGGVGISGSNGATGGGGGTIPVTLIVNVFASACDLGTLSMLNYRDIY